MDFSSSRVYFASFLKRVEFNEHLINEYRLLGRYILKRVFARFLARFLTRFLARVLTRQTREREREREYPTETSTFN